MSKSVEFLIRQNLIKVFSERDAEKRRAIIASLWAADGVFIDPDGVHVGRAETPAPHSFTTGAGIQPLWMSTGRWGFDESQS